MPEFDDLEKVVKFNDQNYKQIACGYKLSRKSNSAHHSTSRVNLSFGTAAEDLSCKRRRIKSQQKQADILARYINFSDIKVRQASLTQ